MAISRISPPAALAGLACALGGAGAAWAAPGFSFNSVEFMPRDQREPAAQAFVAEAARPGASMPRALAAMQRADAFCHAPDPSGAVRCTHESLQHHPGEQLDNIHWVVTLRPNPDGSVASATVVREKYGT